jgi:hypothetical protein
MKKIPSFTRWRRHTKLHAKRGQQYRLRTGLAWRGFVAPMDCQLRNPFRCFETNRWTGMNFSRERNPQRVIQRWENDRHVESGLSQHQKVKKFNFTSRR